jgi:hypothetical protein
MTDTIASQNIRLSSWTTLYINNLELFASSPSTELPYRMGREENQLDVTECFIALMIRSKCFGQFYAHHQELETIYVLLLPMLCSA